MILHTVLGYHDMLWGHQSSQEAACVMMWQSPLYWFNSACRICLQQGSLWPALPPLGSGWFNRLLVTQESGMTRVLLLCRSWATSCYRSAPTHLQGVGHASKNSDIKRHGRHTNIRKHTYTELGLSGEQQAEISPFITLLYVCVSGCV